MGIWDFLRHSRAKAGRSRRQRAGGQDARKAGRSKPRGLRLERCEERTLLAIGPQLVAVIPQQGTILASGGTLRQMPSELTLRFTEGQTIDASTIAKGIVIERSGGDNAFGASSTKADVPVAIGWEGLSELAGNEVIVRFAETLPDDLYRITFVGDPDAAPNQLRNNLGYAFGQENLADTGHTSSLQFTVDLSPQVTAVVPQPVARKPLLDGSLNPYSLLDVIGTGASLTSPTAKQFQVTNGTQTVVFSYTTGAASETKIKVASGDSAATVATKTRDAINAYNTAHPTFGVTVDAPTADPETGLLTRLTFHGGTTAVKVDALTSGFTFVDSELVQSGKTIEVYFSEDVYHTGTTGSSAQNPAFYSLFALNDNSNPTDDVRIPPVSVVYPDTTAPAGVYRAVLTFPDVLGSGSYRLRVGDEFQTITTSTWTAGTDTAAGNSTFAGADVLAGFTGANSQSLVVSAVITPPTGDEYPLLWPGSRRDPGARSLPPNITIPGSTLQGNESHVGGADGTSGVGDYAITYSFPDVYGQYPPGTVLHNQINAEQKQRTREILELYSRYLGVQFKEVESGGSYQIVTGDLRVVDPMLGNAGGISNGSMVIMNSSNSWDDSYGGNWFTTAMHELGHNLGFVHDYDLPSWTAMGGGAPPTGYTTEPVYPGAADIIHGEYMHRPDSRDIDLYRFDLTGPGMFSVETTAQRLSSSNALDTLVTLYNSNHEVVARNDDYFGKDSFLSLHLDGGTYYVAVTASGNDAFDPESPDTGMGGRSQGLYDLRLTIQPDAAQSIVDNPSAGTPNALDGDSDGAAGGHYDFWFNAVDGTGNKTLFVDKIASQRTGTLGSATNPYTTISEALAAANEGDIVRIVGNNFDNDNYGRTLTAATIQDGRRFTLADESSTLTFEFDTNSAWTPANVRIPIGTTYANTPDGVAQAMVDAINAENAAGRLKITATRSGSQVMLSGRSVFFDAGNSSITDTLQDNLAYEIGYNNYGETLSDGATMDVPRGVTVMIDAGAVIKLRQANIDVGSSMPGLAGDRSRGVLQVLGTPCNSVYFTSYNDQSVGNDTFTNTTLPAKGDWGGLVFRNNVDYDAMSTDPSRQVYEQDGIFLNYVNHADIRYGGGQVSVFGVTDTYDAVHLVRARPTVSFNVISRSKDAAISADPNSFEESRFEWSTLTGDPYNFAADYDRVGPDIHGNYLADNSINGMFVRISRDRYGNMVDTLDVAATFDDRDIVHVIQEVLKISSSPGGLINGGISARLKVDPGVVLKFSSSRIETEMGGHLIAEGTQNAPVIFTSLFDDRYGAGGTFDTSNDKSSTSAAAGNWSGLSLGPLAKASLDWARVYYAGGLSSIEGSSATFNPIEIRQADARITNSLFEYNAAQAAGNRNGRGWTDDSTIFIRGSQPVIVGNTFLNNQGAVMSIDAGAMSANVTADWGRSTPNPEASAGASGESLPLGAFGRFDANYGPLIRLNLLNQSPNQSPTGNEQRLNGLLVRGNCVLQNESVWDDTDIAHVLFSEIVIDNFHHYGGLRLQSSDTESLVIKLSGASAGFTAQGTPTEIDDRIGGTIHVIGTGSHPVVFTSLADDTVPAGYKPGGNQAPQYDTNGNGSLTTPQPGNWRSIKIATYANDINVAAINELEATVGSSADANSTPAKSQYLGTLAPDSKSGDDVQRLGFQVQGTIRHDAPSDADMYRFTGTPGSEVWIDIDRTEFSLDTQVELVDFNGNVLAWSDDSGTEIPDDANDDPQGYLEGDYGLARTLRNSVWTVSDFYTTNPRDAGFRVVLPYALDPLRLPDYYVRVHAAVNMLDMPSGSQIQNGQYFFLSDGILANSAAVPNSMKFSLDAGADATTSTAKFVKFKFQLGYAGTDPSIIGYVGNETPAQIAQLVRDKINAANVATLLGVTAEAVDGAVKLTLLSGSTIRFNAGTSAVKQANPTGAYQLQIRLQEEQQFAGCTVTHADIRYATNGIEIIGQPMHSPILGESIEIEATGGASNNTVSTTQQLGNLLATDQEVIAWGGSLSGMSDVDFTQFQMGLNGIQAVGANRTQWPVTIDLDYASGMNRPDTSVYVFDANNQLILIGQDSSVADDQQRPNVGTDSTNLDAGSFGPLDPLIGPVYLPTANTPFGVSPTVYNVAVANRYEVPSILDEYAQDRTDATSVASRLLRREPVNSVQRIIEDHIGVSDYSGVAKDSAQGLLFNVTNGDDWASQYDNSASFQTKITELNTYADDLTFGDVSLYVLSGSDLFTVNPYTGTRTSDVTGTSATLPLGNVYQDLAMRNDGHLQAVAGSGTGKANVGRLQELNTGVTVAANPTPSANNGINTGEQAATNPATSAAVSYDLGISFNAMAYDPTSTPVVTGSTSSGSNPRYMLAIGNMPSSGTHPNNPSDAYEVYQHNLLYLLGPDGTAVQKPGTSTTTRLTSDIIPLAIFDTITANITGLAFANGYFYAVDAAGNLYRMTNASGNPYTIGNAAAGSLSTSLWGASAADDTNGSTDPNFPNSVVKDAANGPRLVLVANLGVAFSGLTVGPQNVEGGAYKDLLFATTSNGRVYAFDTNGTLQNVFSGNANNISTGLTSATGLAFTNVDYNLWHASLSRATDAGHGLSATYDSSRSPTSGGPTQSGYPSATASSTGNLSFYFGLEDPRAATVNGRSMTWTNWTGYNNQPGAINYTDRSSSVFTADTSLLTASGLSASAASGGRGTYDVPGGAYGTLTTDSFSLYGYGAADKPALYFTYFLSTQGGDQYDGAKVYISKDNGSTWTVIATSVDMEGGSVSNPSINQAVRQNGGTKLHANTGWRQAKIDLSNYAGETSLTLRFSFDTRIYTDTGNNYSTPTLDNLPGQSNHYDGFYVDDIIIGCTERGEMVTGSPAIQTTTNVFQAADSRTRYDVAYPYSTKYMSGTYQFAITDGAYQVEIRAAAPYGTYDPGPQGTTPNLLNLWAAYDTNDRFTDAISILAPAGGASASNKTFTIGDGVNKHTFTVSIGANESAASVAAKIAGQINSYYTNNKTSADWIDVTASLPAGTSNHVDLFGATWVSGIENNNYGSSYKAYPIDAGAISQKHYPSFNIDTITPAKSGTKIAYVSNEDGNNEIYVMDADGSNVVKLTNTATNVDNIEPIYLTIDMTSNVLVGDCVLYSSKTGSGKYQLKLLPVPGASTTGIGYGLVINSLLNKVNGGGGNVVDAKFGVEQATGTAYLIYSSDEDGDYEVYRLELNYPTPNPTKLTNNTGFADRHPAFNLDGSKIVYSSDVDGNEEIYVMNSDGSNPTNMTNNPARDTYPSYGGLDVIVYQTDRRGNNDVWIIAGSANPWLTTESSSDVEPAIDIFGSQVVFASNATGEYDIYWMSSGGGLANQLTGTSNGVYHAINTGYGDANHPRSQGQIVIDANRISDCAYFGVNVDSSARDSGQKYWVPGDSAQPNSAHPGFPLPQVSLNWPNVEGYVPGIMISNNVLVGNGRNQDYQNGGGIHFSGDNAAGPRAAVPFGRIVNNTIYGFAPTDPALPAAAQRGTGILVDQNASPTLMNNIVARLSRGIYVDGTSTSTVIEATLYQGNAVQNSNVGVGSYAIQLGVNQSPFVNESQRNFIPAAGSQAIDSSLDQLAERPEMSAIRLPLGIPDSPIWAPDYDYYGQKRADDADVAPSGGVGQNVYKDRGAIDRIDTTGPTVAIVNPADNGTLDVNGALLDVEVHQSYLNAFTLQLYDINGVGIDDATLDKTQPALSSIIKIEKVNPVGYVDYTTYTDSTTLVGDVDYLYSYDVTNDKITIYPSQGVWDRNWIYKITLNPLYEVTLDPADRTIRDLAGNPLEFSRPSVPESTSFTVATYALDFGDAPYYESGKYPSLERDNGAAHAVKGQYYLGAGVTGEDDAYQVPNSDGGDLNDDGIVFSNVLVIGQSVTFTASVSKDGLPVGADAGYLSAWIDFNGDHDWDDANEQVVTAAPMQVGTNYVSFTVPAGLEERVTFARFRLSTADDLSPVGTAPDGEVEDYSIRIARSVEDFGDAPNTNYRTVYNAGGGYYGARHDVSFSPTDATRFDFGTAGSPVEGGYTPVTEATRYGIAGSLTYGWQSGTVSSWNDAGGVDALARDYNATNNGTFAVDLPNGTYQVSVTIGDPSGTDHNLAGIALEGKQVDAIAATATPVTHTYWVTVKDGQLNVRLYDLGGSDDPRATIQALVVSVPDLTLGALVDAESDGQPSSDAMGDNASSAGGVNDEDGVAFLSPFSPGLDASLQVTVGSPSGAYAGQQPILNVWIDWNRDGDFTDPGEHVMSDLAVEIGDNVFDGSSLPAIAVPADARTDGPTFVRFRLSAPGETGLGPDGVLTAGPRAGEAPFGEVEDYQITVLAEPYDYGDAPDRPFTFGGNSYPAMGYPTSKAVSGTNAAKNLYDYRFHLGPTVDYETDARLGDPANPGRGDFGDDGVVLTTYGSTADTFLVRPGATNEMQVDFVNELGVTGYFNAWIDYNFDGVFDSSERLFENDIEVTASEKKTFTFTVPDDVVAQPITFLRARFSADASGLLPTGPTSGVPDVGEIEDYPVTILSAPLDFGDAAASYDTGAGEAAGANSIYDPDFHLGGYVDFEAAPRSSDDASGDDSHVGGTYQRDIPASPPRIPAQFDFGTPGAPPERLAAGYTAVAETSYSAALGYGWLLGAVTSGDAGGDALTDDYNATRDGTFVLDVPNGTYVVTLTAGNAAGDSVRIQIESLAPFDIVTGAETTATETRTVTVTDGQLSVRVFDPSGTVAKALDALIVTTLSDDNGVTVANDYTSDPNKLTFVAGVDNKLTVSIHNPLTDVFGDPRVRTTAYLNVWIDFDGNGTFESTEHVIGQRDDGSGGYENYNLLTLAGVPSGTLHDDIEIDHVVVPWNALEGPTTMRVWLTADANPDPLNPSHGEVEDYQVTIVQFADFGDAPDTHKTLATSNGPRNFVDPNGPNLYLGTSVDSEWPGNASADAGGDSYDDGVRLVTYGDQFEVRAGVENILRVDVIKHTADAYVSAWIDYNGDGTWDDSERIVNDQPVSDGVNLFAFTPLYSVPTGSKFLRVRLSDTSGMGAVETGTGTGSHYLAQGEVEDYQITVAAPPMDYGDALDTYGTLPGSNGARALYDPYFHLGAYVDFEDAIAALDGTATTDDLTAGRDQTVLRNGLKTTTGVPNTGSDDEDGVEVTNVYTNDPNKLTFVAGVNNTLTLTVYNPDQDVAGASRTQLTPYLSVWIDLNGSGTWDSGEQVIQNNVLLAAFSPTGSNQAISVTQDGSTAVTLVMPWNVADQTTAMRVRLSSEAMTGPTGVMTDGTTGAPLPGEVEDYQVTIVQFADFGDAPDTHKTLATSNGPRNFVDPNGPNLYLGTNVDSEWPGNASATANGDGTDDDGVRLVTYGDQFRLLVGVDNILQATVVNPGGQPAYLSAWIDYNGDGTWDNSAGSIEKIISNVEVTAGGTFLFHVVPDWSKLGNGVNLGNTFLRVRLSDGMGFLPTGGGAASPGGNYSATGLYLPQGEVEDYQITIAGPPKDYGDAPDNASITTDYPTLAASNGASAWYNPNFCLGQYVDFEPDGQPSSDAKGDDNGAGGNQTYFDAGGNVLQALSPNSGNDDDGVLFLTYGVTADNLPILRVGVENTIQVTLYNPTGKPAYLSAWIDYYDASIWSNAGDQRFADNISTGQLISDNIDVATGNNINLQNGVNTFTFTVPWGVTDVAKTTYLRFRLSDVPGVGYAGEVSAVAAGMANRGFGEIEDYKVSLQPAPLDFGDAPDGVTKLPQYPNSTYPTTLARNGARNLYDPNFCLGQNVDFDEQNGAPYAYTNQTATGDGQNLGGTVNGPAPAGYVDDDGVKQLDGTVLATLTNGYNNTITVTVHNPVEFGRSAYLSAWIDFNGDGDWADAGEQLIRNNINSATGSPIATLQANGALLGGDQEITFTFYVPYSAVSKTTFVRFRLTDAPLAAGDPGYSGAGTGIQPPRGEVEDYQVSIVHGLTAPTLNTTQPFQLSAINKNDQTNLGTTVADIIASSGIDSITCDDPTSAEGIAVIGVDTAGHGQWQYSTDGGTTWLDLSAASPTASRLLGATANNRIRFVPDIGYYDDGVSAKPSIQFRAWDRMRGISGTTADTTTNGDPTAYSTASGTATITVNFTNVAPVLTGVPATATIPELAAYTFDADATDADLPAQTLTFSLVGAPAGAAIDAVSGVFTWTPGEADGPADYTFTVRVTDGLVNTDRQVTLHVTEVSVPPVLTGVPASATIPELQPYTFDADATDSDLPAQTLTFSLIGAPAGATIDPVSGVFNWTPTEAQGPFDHTFTVRVNDGYTNTDQSVTLHVTEVNTAPVLSGVPASATIPEEAAYTFDADATDADLPSQTLTFSLVGAPTGAAIDPTTGVFTWTPTEGQGPGEFTFSVRVNDGFVDADLPVTLYVTEVNVAPVLSGVPAEATINELAEYTFDADATDADQPSQTLTFSLVGAPAGARIDSASGVFTWTPTEAQGPNDYTFTVRVSDGEVDTDQSVTLHVSEVNAPPVLSGVPDEATIAELAEYTFDADATDADLPAQTLTFSLVGAPAGATIDPTTGVFTWTPTEAQGPNDYTFSVRVSDGTANVDQPVTLHVTEVNAAPVLSGVPAEATIDELAEYTFDADATDADLPAQTLTFSLVGAPAGATIDSASGVFTWTPTEPQGAADYTFTVRVSDGVANTDQSVTLHVNEVHVAPVLSNVPSEATIDEQAEYTFDADATDADLPAQTLTFSLVGAPAGATIDPASGVFRWTPTEAQGPGDYTFAVRVSDGVLTADQTLTLHVLEVNAAPVLINVPSEATIPELQPYTFDADATDSDGAGVTLTFSLVGAPAGATIHPTSGVFQWTPTEAQGPGDHVFTVRVTDGLVNTDQQVTLHVTEVNTAPVLTGVPANATIPELQPYTFDADATDSDLPAQTLTFSLVGAPAGATIDPASGVFTWTPTEAQGAFDHTFTVRVNDGYTNTDRSVTLHVTEVNTAPVLSGVPASATIPEQAAYTFDADATDADLPAQTLTFSLVGAPTGATIHPTTGVFTWTPTEGQGPNDYTFSVRVSDGTANVDQSVTLHVTEVNVAPVLSGVPASATIPEVQAYTFDANATDVDLPAQTLTFSLVGAPAGATIHPTTGVFTWTPTEAQGPNDYTFTVRVSDGVVNTDQAVTLHVNEVNVAPVLSNVPASATIPELQPYTFDADATDVDLPAQTLTFSLVGAPAGAAIDAVTGVFTWTPTEAQGPGDFAFSVRVSDGVTNTDRPVTLHVSEVNAVPVLGGIEAAALVYTEGDPATAITASITAVDADHANLAGATIRIAANYQNGQDVLWFANTATITGTWNATTGTLTLTGTDTVGNYQAALRSVTYRNTSAAPIKSTRTVTFQVTDGVANSNLQTRDITVIYNPDPVVQAPAGSGTNNLWLRLDAARGFVQLLNRSSNAVLREQPANTLNSLTVTGVDNKVDLLTVDFDYGGAFEIPGGLRFDGGAGRSSDVLVLHGQTTGSVFRSLDDHYELDGVSIEGVGLEQVRFEGLKQNDTFVVTALPVPLLISDSGGVDTLDFTGASQQVSVNPSSTSSQRVFGTGNTLTLRSKPETTIVQYGPDPVLNAPAGGGSLLLTFDAGCVQLLSGKNLLLSQPLSSPLNSLEVIGADNKTDTLTVDVNALSAGGIASIPGGVAFTGGAGAKNSDTLVIKGTTGDNLFQSSSDGAAITVGDATTEFTFAGVEQVRFESLAGNDTYAIAALNVPLTIIDKGGTDTLDFSGAAVGVSIDLRKSTGQKQMVFGEGATLALRGTLENVIGTAFADLIHGNSAKNLIRGGDGNDTIYGNGGSDLLLGGAGDDWLYGGSGKSVLIGGLGVDNVKAGSKGDILIGGETAFDDSPDDLVQILAEWTAKGTPASHVANLTQGLPPDQRINLRQGDGVIDDESADVLYGGSGSDWFLFFADDTLKNRSTKDFPPS